MKRRVEEKTGGGRREEKRIMHVEEGMRRKR